MTLLVYRPGLLLAIDVALIVVAIVVWRRGRIRLDHLTED